MPSSGRDQGAGALLPKKQLCRLYEQATQETHSFLFVYHLKLKNKMFYKRFEERFALEKDADGGSLLSGPEAVLQLTLINAKCKNIFCCTSVAAVPSFVGQVAF